MLKQNIKTERRNKIKLYDYIFLNLILVKQVIFILTKYRKDPACIPHHHFY